MRRFAFLLSVLAVMASVPAAPAVAQAPDTPVSSDAGAYPAAAPAGASTQAPGFAGTERAALPAEVGQPPRTLRAYWHVFIAFAVTWLLLFGYVISLGRRWSALERQVQMQGGAR
jgi:CcmD family protein